MDFEHELKEFADQNVRLRCDARWLKFGLKLRKFLAQKAGFDPEQPRDELGMWTDSGGAGSAHDESSSENRVATVFADVAGTSSYANNVNDSVDNTGSQVQPVAAQITGDNARTGIPTIDNMTEKLTDDLMNVMDTLEFLPNQPPQVYGVAVHAAFAATVKANDYPGIGREGVEQSFRLTEVVDYGLAGSIRTDVVLRDVGGDVIAIYDLKTGGAVLSASRADELRAHTGALPNTPVIELHFYRGSSLKHEQITPDLRSHLPASARHCGGRKLPAHYADRLHRARFPSGRHGA